eukprot:411608_1
MPGSPHIIANPDYNLCISMCQNTPNCVAWTYQPPHTYPGCSSETNPNPQCWLKNNIPSQTPFPCVTSGVIGGIPPSTLSPSRPGCTSH